MSERWLANLVSKFRTNTNPPEHGPGCQCPPCYYSDDEPFTGTLRPVVRPSSMVQRGGHGSVNVQGSGSVVLGGSSGDMNVNGIRLTGAARNVRFADGLLSIDGVSVGRLRPGDHVHVADGVITLNGEKV